MRCHFFSTFRLASYLFSLFSFARSFFQYFSACLVVSHFPVFLTSFLSQLMSVSSFLQHRNTYTYHRHKMTNKRSLSQKYKTQNIQKMFYCALRKFVFGMAVDESHLFIGFETSQWIPKRHRLISYAQHQHQFINKEWTIQFGLASVKWSLMNEIQHQNWNYSLLHVGMWTKRYEMRTW